TRLPPCSPLFPYTTLFRSGVLRDNLIHKMTDNDWDLVVDTHLKGTFLCAQAAQRVMVPARWGKMVFLSSNSALGNRGQVNYSARSEEHTLNSSHVAISYAV